MLGVLGGEGAVQQRTDYTSTNGLVARGCCAGPDTNRSVGLSPDTGSPEDGPCLAKGQACGLTRPARPIRSPGLGAIAATQGKPEFTNCRSDLSMQLREHVYAGRKCCVG